MKINLEKIKTDENGIAKDQRPLFNAAVQEYLTKPQKMIEAIKKTGLSPGKIQEYTVAGDFPASVLAILKTFQNETSYDTGWEEIFDIQDFTNSQRNGFRIVDLFDGLSFRVVMVGEKLKVYQAYGSDVTVTFDRHGGALGWDRGLLDDKEYWAMENILKAFRNTYYSYKAGVHYALIEAVAGTLVWAAHPDGVAAGNLGFLAGRDAATINNAIIQILNGVAGSGYDNVTPLNAQFKILVPLQLYQRIREALAFNIQVNSPIGNRLLPVGLQIIPTTMLATTNVYYVILPENKLISGNRMDLTLFSDFDSLSYTDTMAAWTRFAGIVGDDNQIARCATA